jgi:hypothetical protein
MKTLSDMSAVLDLLHLNHSIGQVEKLLQFRIIYKGTS